MITSLIITSLVLYFLGACVTRSYLLSFEREARESFSNLALWSMIFFWPATIGAQLFFAMLMFVESFF